MKGSNACRNAEQITEGLSNEVLYLLFTIFTYILSDTGNMEGQKILNLLTKTGVFGTFKFYFLYFQCQFLVSYSPSF